MACLSDERGFVGWDGIGTVIIGRRKSESTSCANNVVCFLKLGKTKRWRAQTLPETPKLMSRSLKAKYVNDGTDEN